MPGIFAIAARIASSTCFWLRARSLRSVSAMLSVAWLRPTEKPCPCPPTCVASVFTSGNACTIASTWRTFSSVRSRLAPVGMRSASCVNAWSVCGTNSLPTSGANASAPAKLSTPTPTTIARGPMKP
jgi:hypothetical protein